MEKFSPKISLCVVIAILLNRVDLLSAAILDYNWSKIERMPNILSKRMKKIC